MSAIYILDGHLESDCPECRKRQEERKEYEAQLAEWLRQGKPGLHRCELGREILGDVADDAMWQAIERAFFASRENE